MIVFEKVTKIYSDSTTALSDVTLSIEPKEFVSVVGHSGAGKTTLIKMLLAEEKPTKGRVFFESLDIHKLTKHEINYFRRKIGTVFQDFRLLPNKTIYENIAFAMEVSGKSDEEIHSDVPHVLDLVDLSEKSLNFPRRTFGRRKTTRSYCACNCQSAGHHHCRRADGNLDPINTYEIIQILKKINDLGTTVILTTHNKGVIDSLGGRVITMDKGRIVRDDSKGLYSL